MKDIAINQTYTNLCIKDFLQLFFDDHRRRVKSGIH